jgi:8-oxo-dGTP pyrophosphatase MutT (NUDIX family)/aminoglycoside phosphotransferase (APT) family kinase protein
VDEVVALYDEEGRPVGAVPRSVMRSQNLRHAATGIVVRDSYGRVYVHRRTQTKDVYPGRWDFTAGGVVLAGEDPLDGARRELDEELGVTGDLLSLGEADYADDHTTYHAFRYVTSWDGEVRLQESEVAYGAWVTLDRLLSLVDDPDVLFMPDTVALYGDWLRERAAEHEPLEDPDCEATLVEGTWIDRRPRHPDVARALRAETTLLPLITVDLPLRVPLPIVVDPEQLRVRHRLVPGVPVTEDALVPDNGRRLGRFLRALHDVPPETYLHSSVADEFSSRAELMATLDRMLHRVLPLLPEDYRARGQDLLHRIGRRTPFALIHGDLEAEHVLTEDDEITAVVGWTDARLGDPAIDLAWPLHGTPGGFAEAVAATYGVSDEQWERAADWYELGPWYDVLWGVGPGGQESVAAGLAALHGRLDTT